MEDLTTNELIHIKAILSHSIDSKQSLLLDNPTIEDILKEDVKELKTIIEKIDKKL